MSGKRPFYIVLIAAILVSRVSAAQEDMERYTASNGLVLSKGDSVTIGVGSMPFGTYRHVFMSSLISPLSEVNIDYCRKNFALVKGQEGSTVVIKKIRKTNGKVYVMVPLGGSTPFIIEVEEAIACCELAFCRPEGYLSQDEFAKLILMQEAVEEGSLTVERFYELRKEFLDTPAATIPEPEHLE
jgi:hypothetical protein